MNTMIKWKEFVTIGLILFVAFVLRLKQLNAPLNDRHYFRQTDTYAIVLNLEKSGGDFFRPQFFQTPVPENIHGYYFGEFPIYQGLIYFLFKFFGESLILARLVNILFSLLAVIAIYCLGKQLFSYKTALVSALAFATLPSSIFWGRAITPDWLAMSSFMIATAIISKSSKVSSILTSSLLMMVSVLIKPYYIVFIPVHFLMIKIQHQLSTTNSIKKIVAIYCLPLAGFFLWRYWASTFPVYTKDPDILNLLHNHLGWWQYWRESRWPLLFWQNHFFGELFTTLGGLLILIGTIILIIKKQRHAKTTIIWLAGVLAITFIISWGSKTHDYYLLPWLPVGSLLIGVAASFLENLVKEVFQKTKSILKRVIIAMIIGVAGVMTFWLLGLSQLLIYTTNYFQPQGYALYTSTYQKELEQIKQVIQASNDPGLMIALLKEYSPLLHNTLQQRGSIYVISENEDCPSETVIADVIDHRFRLGSKYLIIDSNLSEQQTICSRASLNEILSMKYQVLFLGDVLTAYRLEEAKLKVEKWNEMLVLTTHRIGSNAQIEIGGLPNTTSTTVTNAGWQQIDDQVYRTSFSEQETENWESFKLYYLSPITEVHHPDWKLENDFIVRK